MRLLIGVTGGIAAYKALETARLAVKQGHAVRAIQTPNSERFVGRASFAAITGAPVLVSEFDEDPARGVYPGEPLPAHAPISHLALVEHADVYLIAPATANTLAKLAAGAADNLVTAAALAAACPVIVAPAMNNRMYLSAATQANLRTLERRGVSVLVPDSGELASRDERGIGRLPEPAALLAACLAQAAGADAAAGSWRGLSVLVSAGGTQEPIDSVRYIGNRSSGRMGYALAQAALDRGAAVTLVAANVHLPVPAGAELIQVRTAAELAAAVRARAPAADVVVMAAAVADFRPAAPVAHKLKKTGPELPDAVALELTEDVLANLAAHRRPGQLLVGFAAEHGGQAIANGREKLGRKQLDAIVVNDVSQPEIGFDQPDNAVTILTRDGRREDVPRASKAVVAAAILDELAVLRADGATAPAPVYDRPEGRS